MIILIGALALALLSVTSASSQTPIITPCSGSPENDIVTIQNVAVSNVVVGQEMTLDYDIELNQDIDGNPQLVFTMKSGGKKLPCIADVGSCTYDMCGGTGKVEQQIAAPWNNECPIAAGSYSNSMKAKISSVAKSLIKGKEGRYTPAEGEALLRREVAGGVGTYVLEMSGSGGEALAHRPLPLAESWASAVGCPGRPGADPGYLGWPDLLLPASLAESVKYAQSIASTFSSFLFGS
ncbi:uncharacterized protein LOC144142974 [Haemaphysalis longicornis]